MKFSIRDLLWLTLVTAILLGWILRDRQVRGELRRAEAWRTRAGGLEHIFETEGWAVNWDFEREEVEAKLQYRSPMSYKRVEANRFEPTVDPISN